MLRKLPQTPNYQCQRRSHRSRSNPNHRTNTPHRSIHQLVNPQPMLLPQLLHLHKSPALPLLPLHTPPPHSLILQMTFFDHHICTQPPHPQHQQVAPPREAHSPPSTSASVAPPSGDSMNHHAHLQRASRNARVAPVYPHPITVARYLARTPKLIWTSTKLGK